MLVYLFHDCLRFVGRSLKEDHLEPRLINRVKILILIETYQS